MATVKQYVDLEGLSKFKELLVGKYTDGTYKVMTATNATNAEIATNYKTADGSASIKDALDSKVDSSTLTTEVNNLVPKTTTIAGINLQSNITAEALVSALDASRKIVNVIETVKVKNNGDSDFSALPVDGKAVQIDLSSYAKTSDITSVLQFRGTVDYVKELPTENVKEGDVYHVRYSGSEGTSGLNAEYVRIGSRWELLGPVVDLSVYYTKTEADSKISTAVTNAKTEITSAYQAADTDLQTALQGNIDALYKVDGESVTGVIATRISDVESTATANEEAINTLNGDENTTGSVAKAIKDKIDALDSSSSMASDTDVKGGYVYSVSQTDGKVSVKTASFSGSVDSEDTNAVTGGAVATYVTNAIGSLDVNDIGSAGSFISAVGETDGKVHATATDFVSSVKAETTDTDNVASNEYAVRQAIDGAYEMITSIPLEGDSGSIASIFALISKTRAFITGTIEVAESDIVTSIADFAFCVCNSLTSVSFPVATSIGNYAFSECSGLTSISFPVVTSIGEGAFQGCSSLTSVSFPVATSIGERAFQNCSSLASVSFPKAIRIGGYSFDNCSSLTTIYVGTESDTVCTLSSTNAIPSSVTDIYVSYSLVDSYKTATNWSSFADKIKADRVPVECISLSITADDVAVGNETSTTVYYTAKCTYTKEGILQEGTTVFTGKGISNSFERNTSTTDTVQREVSFTFMGKTATTTITQGVWVNRSITVTTEGNYGWVMTADSKYTVDGYDVYMSTNEGVGKSQAVMKLKCKGYTDLTLYIRSYAESTFDYTIASKVNVSNYPKDYYSSDVKAHTSGKQNSGTKLNDYTAVEYKGLKDNDTIYIVFRKDSSGDKGDDRGYVLIPKA